MNTVVHIIVTTHPHQAACMATSIHTQTHTQVDTRQPGVCLWMRACRHSHQWSACMQMMGMLIWKYFASSAILSTSGYQYPICIYTYLMTYPTDGMPAVEPAVVPGFRNVVLITQLIFFSASMIWPFAFLTLNKRSNQFYMPWHRVMRSLSMRARNQRFCALHFHCWVPRMLSI